MDASSEIIVRSKPCHECKLCEQTDSLEKRTFTMAKCETNEDTIFTPGDAKLILNVNTNGGFMENTHLLLNFTKDFKQIRRASMPTTFEDGSKGYRGFEIISPINGINKKQFSPLEAALELSQAIQGHDNETHAHDIRVGELTSIIGELTIGNLRLREEEFLKQGDYESLILLAELDELKKKEEERDPFYRDRFKAAGILHDIGKSFISSDILKKTDKLNDEEFIKMKYHALFGFKLLHGIPGLEESATSALFHHEQWKTGNGYYKMRNSLVPLIANIVSAADIIDAMATPRYYRPQIQFPYNTIKEMISGLNPGDFKGNFVGFWHPVVTSTILENWDSIIVPYHSQLYTKYPDNYFLNKN